MNLREGCLIKIQETFKVCESYFHMSLDRPRIRFDLKGSRAGIAYYHENLIRLNSALLNENADKFIYEIPGHEAAHLIARRVFGLFIQPHGVEWARIMQITGQPPVRCHNFEVKTNKTYICKCENKKHYLSTYRHNQILSGKRNYLCSKCKSSITWEKLVK